MSIQSFLNPVTNLCCILLPTAQIVQFQEKGECDKLIWVVRAYPLMAIDNTDENLFGFVELTLRDEDVTKICFAIKRPEMSISKVLFDDGESCSKVGLCVFVLAEGVLYASKISNCPQSIAMLFPGLLFALHDHLLHDPEGFI